MAESNRNGKRTPVQRAYVGNARDNAQARREARNGAGAGDRTAGGSSATRSESGNSSARNTTTGSRNTESARNTGARSTGTGSRSAGTGSRSTGAGSRSTGTGSRSTGTGSRSAGTGSRSAGTGSRSTGTGSRSTGTGSRSASSGSRSTGAKRTSSLEYDERLKFTLEEDDSLRDEIAIILVLLVAVLFVLSYFGLCGSFGEFINGILFGLMGGFAYAFPFALAFVAIFAIANRNNRSIAAKTVYCAMMMVFISGLVQMAMGGFNPDMSIKEYYTNAAPTYEGSAKSFGGFLGGILCRLLCPYLGNVGATVVMVAAVIIFFLLIVGKALFTSLTRSGIQSIEEHREERREREEYERIEREEQEQREREEYERRRAERAVRENDRNEKVKPDSDDGYEYDELLDDDFFLEDMKEKKKKKDKGSFVDSLMRRGMGIEMDRIADTPEYQKLKENYGKTDFEMGEIESDEASQGETTAEGADVDPEDIVASELRKKFGGNTGLEVPQLREHPVISKTGMTRTVMVDDEPEDGGERIVSLSERLRKNAQAVSDTEHPEAENIKAENNKAENNKAENIKAENHETDAESGDASALKNRTQSGATSFTTPEQLAAFREEQEKKPEPPYVFPPLSLLKKGQPAVKTAAGANELANTVDKLQKAFESFGVGVTVTDATCGPTVTRYELLPDQGVKVKNITSLSDDIKLALAAPEIRIEAPIPGKAAVGIEVPNATTSPVLLRDLLESTEFKDAQSNLTFAVGKDIGGKTICFDIASMPHMLIAGATGSGKSVCINALILSIIYKAKPSDVRMIMIDPKRVELIGYNGIPHLLVPVVTDVKKATGALNWAIAEMDDRYERFANAGVNNLASYNRQMEEKYYEEGNEGECPDRLPQILIIVDELNDLMMTANSKEVEASICRLTQLARASGIHVVLATQRPSVNVITGTIKANIPSRIAFSVSSIVDSRTIIDQAGAEKLLGKGDMLFYPQGYPKPVRLQGAYVSDKEIAGVVDFIKSKCKEVSYRDDVSRHIEKNSSGEGTKSSGSGSGFAGGQSDSDGDGHDELFGQAGAFIIKKQKASIGMLQREFKIGFNRAARIMDQLADEDVVGPEEGTKPRRILMTLPQFEAHLTGEDPEDNSTSDEDNY